MAMLERCKASEPNRQVFFKMSGQWGLDIPYDILNVNLD